MQAHFSRSASGTSAAKIVRKTSGTSATKRAPPTTARSGAGICDYKNGYKASARGLPPRTGVWEGPARAGPKGRARMAGWAAKPCCPEPSEPPPAKLVLKVELPEKCGVPHDPKCSGKTRAVHAAASAEWPGLYHGVLDVKLGPITHQCDGPTIHVDFPKRIDTVASVFVVLHYETDKVPAQRKGVTRARV